MGRWFEAYQTPEEILMGKYVILEEYCPLTLKQDQNSFIECHCQIQG